MILLSLFLYLFHHWPYFALLFYASVPIFCFLHFLDEQTRIQNAPLNKCSWYRFTTSCRRLGVTFFVTYISITKTTWPEFSRYSGKLHCMYVTAKYILSKRTRQKSLSFFYFIWRKFPLLGASISSKVLSW